MAKKKYIQPTLDLPGLDWNDPKYQVKPEDVPPSMLADKNPVDSYPVNSRYGDLSLPPEVKYESPGADHNYGYHATDPSNIEGIRKEGIKSSNRWAGVPGKELGIDQRIHRGVFFEWEPHAIYGDAVIRIKIPNHVKVYGENSFLRGATRPRGMDGLNVTGNVPKSWVSVYGHLGDVPVPWSQRSTLPGREEMNSEEKFSFHKTEAHPDECAACRIEHMYSEDMRKRNLGAQFD